MNSQTIYSIKTEQCWNIFIFFSQKLPFCIEPCRFIYLFCYFAHILTDKQDVNVKILSSQSNKRILIVFFLGHSTRRDQMYREIQFIYRFMIFLYSFVCFSILGSFLFIPHMNDRCIFSRRRLQMIW